MEPALMEPPNSCHAGVTSGVQQAPLVIFSESIAVLQPEEKKVEREADREDDFNKVSDEAWDAPNGYLKVEVLIIRWHENIDEFKGHTKEVQHIQDEVWVWLLGSKH
jgi:hypothetical protein